MQDSSWQRWVSNLKRGQRNMPPLELLGWWAKLKRSCDPASAQRLEQVISTGQWVTAELTKDLGNQLSRIRRGQLWTYQDCIDPLALSIEHKGFYVAVKNPEQEALSL